MAVQSSKVRKLKNIAIRGAVVVIAYFVLSEQLLKHGTLASLSEAFIRQIDDTRSFSLLLLVCLLMLLNWALEALKWKLLIRKSENISFLRSLKAVFTGVSVGTFTPNRIGEFLGRSFLLDQSHPWKVFFMTMVGSFGQLLATIVCGAAGFLFFSFRYSGFSTGITYLDLLILFFAIVAVLLLVLLFFNISLVDELFGKWIRRRRPEFAKYLHVIAEYNTGDLMKVLLLSFGRYAVFSFQMIVLLRFFQLPVPVFDTLIFTSVSYLVMAMIPSVALSEIGVRGSVNLYFFGYFWNGTMGAEASLALLSSSTLLWLINLVVPAILGTFFVYHLRIFRNGKPEKA